MSIHKSEVKAAAFGFAPILLGLAATMFTASPGEVPQQANASPRLPAEFVGVGQGATVLQYRDYELANGHPYRSRNQSTAPSCVGQAGACAVDMLAALEWKQPTPRASASWIYGASREGKTFKGGGSFCIYACEGMQRGLLFEEDLFLLDYDLTGDNPHRDREFGRELPEVLRPLAVHRITNYYQLRSYNDVRDALHANMAVFVGSSVGFGKAPCYRDKDGFLKRPFFYFRGKVWNHAMAFIGACDSGRRGILVQNSWGDDWVTGQKRFGDEPEGSFWVDASTVDQMVRMGDCFAIQGLQ